MSPVSVGGGGAAGRTQPAPRTTSARSAENRSPESRSPESRRQCPECPLDPADARANSGAEGALEPLIRPDIPPMLQFPRAPVGLGWKRAPAYLAEHKGLLLHGPLRRARGTFDRVRGDHRVLKLDPREGRLAGTLHEIQHHLTDYPAVRCDLGQAGGSG